MWRPTGIAAQRTVARIDAVLLNAVEKLGLLGSHGLLYATLEHVEKSRAENGPYQPTQAGKAQRDDTEGEERIHGHLAQKPIHVHVDKHQGTGRTANGHGDYAARKLKATPRLA